MYLSGLVLGENLSEDETRQSGVILNNRYEEVSRTRLHGNETLDFHEFNVFPEARTAIVATTKQERKDAPEVNATDRRVFNMGFQEIMLDSGIPKFVWDPLRHEVLLNESYDAVGKKKEANYWDYL